MWLRWEAKELARKMLGNETEGRNVGYRWNPDERNLTAKWEAMAAEIEQRVKSPLSRFADEEGELARGPLMATFSSLDELRASRWGPDARTVHCPHRALHAPSVHC